GKLVDAMQNGTPCVKTSVGADGEYGKFDPNGFVEDKHQEFTNKCVTLDSNEKLWLEKHRTGLEIINQRYKKDRFQTEFLNRISGIYSQLATHRLNNFTGQMLQRQNMQSTKYLSKWIEAKNK